MLQTVELFKNSVGTVSSCYLLQSSSAQLCTSFSTSNQPVFLCLQTFLPLNAKKLLCLSCTVLLSAVQQHFCLKETFLSHSSALGCRPPLSPISNLHLPTREKKEMRELRCPSMSERTEVKRWDLY